jgi:hypothetical protein
MNKIRGQNGKQTQGYKKLKQHTEDLARNEVFLKKLRKFKKAWEQHWAYEKGENEINDRIEKLHMEYQSMLWEFEEINEEWDVIKMLKELAIEYGLDDSLVLELISRLSGKEKGDLLENYDFCDINDNYEEYVDPRFTGIPVELNFEKQSHALAYPVRLDIHKYASKRDVLDFVEKRWNAIQNTLGKNRPPNPPRFRERKQPREMLDFIWNNRNKTLKAIKKELDDKFPKNGLVDFEIGKIISQEKGRRLRKISVGQ